MKQLISIKVTLLTLVVGLLATPLFSQWNLQTSGTTGTLHNVHFFNSSFGAAVGPNANVITTDGGVTWNTTPVGIPMYDVNAISPTTVVMCGENGNFMATILRSTDQGATWTGSTPGAMSFLQDLDFANSQRGMAVGTGGIAYLTNDGGVTWNLVSVGTTDNLYGVSFAHPDTAYIASLNGAVYKSVNGGQNWSQVLAPVASRTFKAVDFIHPDSGFAVGSSQFGNLYMTTTNGGSIWGGGGWATNSTLEDIHLLSWDEAFAATGEPTVWRSFVNWSWIPESIPGVGANDSILGVFFLNNQEGWAVGSNGIIAHTSTGGNCSPAPRALRNRVCTGDSTALLSADGWNNYTWTDSATSNVLSTSSIHVFFPPNDMTIYFSASHPVCGTYMDTIRIDVVNCDSVWPGDANADGVANMNDLLYIGYGAGSTGPVRPGATNNWNAQFATDWGQTFGLVVDYKHGDCDGNGIIDVNDTLPLSLNYGLTHNKSNGASSNTGIPFYLEPMFDSLRVSDTGYVRIMLGDAANQVQNLHGISFVFNYDNTLIDSASVSISYDSTWIAPTNMAGVGMYKDFYSQGRTDGGYTHVNQLNSSGFGMIGGITFVTIDNISGKKEILRKMLGLGLTGVLALDKDLNPLEIDARSDSVVVFDSENVIPAGPTGFDLVIYPNPTTGMVRIETGQPIVEKATVTDLRGKVLRQFHGMRELNLSHLPNGTYILQVTTDEGTHSKRLQIMK